MLFRSLHPGEGRADLSTWYVQSDPTVHAHELGHQMRFRDEYVDATVPNRATPTSPGVANDGGLMTNFWERDPVTGRSVPRADTHLPQRNVDELGAEIRAQRQAAGHTVDPRDPSPGVTPAAADTERVAGQTERGAAPTERGAPSTEPAAAPTERVAPAAPEPAGAGRATSVEDRFVEDFRARNPDSPLTEQELRTRFRAGERMNAEGELAAIPKDQRMAVRRQENAELMEGPQFAQDVQARGISEERLQWKIGRAHV